MCTIEWQPLGVNLGYDTPAIIEESGLGPDYDDCIERARELHGVLSGPFPAQAGYAVSLAYRIRYIIQMNAREAIHLLELRSGPQGHPSYRRAAQDMHNAIRDVAGHKAIAEVMIHVDHGSTDLERLESERRAEQRRLTVVPES
jgi:hypothetical protein